MNRLAYDAALEATELFAEIAQRRRQNGTLPPSPREEGSRSPPASSDDDDDEGWNRHRPRPRRNLAAGDEDQEWDDVIDVSAPARRKPPSFQSIAMMVPIRAPRSRRPPLAAERDRERDRDSLLDDEADEEIVPRVPPPPPPQPSVTFEPALAPLADDVLVELGEPGSPSDCFACMYARDRLIAPVARKAYERLAAILRSSASGGNRIALAREMAQYYEDHIRTPANRQMQTDETPLPVWKACDIFQHFFTPFHNRIDSVGSHERIVLELEHAASTIADRQLYMWRTIDGGRRERVIDPKAMEMYMKVTGQIARMHNTDPQKLKMAASDAPNPVYRQHMAGRNVRLLGNAPPSGLL